MKLIQRALDQTRGSNGTCLFFVGEAGSGKTRLLQETMAQARFKGMTVLSGGTAAMVAHPAFGLLAEALRSWIRTAPLPEPELRTFAAGLRQVLPEWPMATRSSDLSPDQMRLLVLEGALRLLLHTAGKKGALLALDDLQNADPETLQFLRHAAVAIGGSPVLIAATIRTPEGRLVMEMARALDREGWASVVDVRTLLELQVSAMVEAIFQSPVPPGLGRHLLAETGGAPLLIEELLDSYVDAGVLRLEDGALHWSQERRAPIPPTIRSLVQNKLERLTPDARTVISAAAVLGAFDPALVAQVADVSSDLVSAGLRQALGAGLLEITEDAPHFRHALIREAILDYLLPAERDELHRQSAEAMAAVFGDDPTWLNARALHLRAIGDHDGAARLLVRVARRNLLAQGPISAEAALREALTIAKSQEVVREAQDAMAETLGALGQWEEALRLDSSLLGGQGDDPERLMRMARNAAQAGRLQEATDLAASAMAAGAAPGPLEALVALVALWQGDLAGAIEHGQQALQQAAGEPEIRCAAMDVIGRAYDAAGRRSDAVSVFKEWEGTARTAGLAMSAVQALLELGNLEFMADSRTENLHRAREIAAETGALVTQVLADLSLGWCLSWMGRLREAVDVTQEALDWCRRLDLGLLPYALLCAAEACELVRAGSGMALMTEACALVPDDIEVRMEAAHIRGFSALRRGEGDVALRHFEDCIAVSGRRPPRLRPTPARSCEWSRLLSPATATRLGRRWPRPGPCPASPGCISTHCGWSWRRRSSQVPRNCYSPS